MADRRLLAALALSLLIHSALVGGPGWRLPIGDEPGASALLVAHLAPRPGHVAAAAQPVRPKARKPRPAAARDVLAVPAPVVAPPAAPAQAPPVEAAPVSAPPAAVAAPAAEARVETAWPRQGRIRFVVTLGEGEQGMPLGESVHRWSHDGASYVLQTVTETTGLIALFRPLRVVMVSEGAIGPDGLAPREFRVERNGQAAEGARFDREGSRMVLTSAGVARREMPLDPGAQDLLSNAYQLGLLGIAARLELMVATGKNYGRYAFEAVGEERLATRFGELRTWHLRTPAMPGEHATELWLAEDHRNLPVRIRHIDRKGDIYDQTAVEIEIDGVRMAERPQ